MLASIYKDKEKLALLKALLGIKAMGNWSLPLSTPWLIEFVNELVWMGGIKQVSKTCDFVAD